MTVKKKHNEKTIGTSKTNYKKIQTINNYEQNIDNLILYLMNHTWREAATYFRISEMTINRWLHKKITSQELETSNITNKILAHMRLLLKKPLVIMKASELRLVYMILTGNNISLTKQQYIEKIQRICALL